MKVSENLDIVIVFICFCNYLSHLVLNLLQNLKISLQGIRKKRIVVMRVIGSLHISQQNMCCMVWLSKYQFCESVGNITLHQCSCWSWDYSQRPLRDLSWVLCKKFQCHQMEDAWKHWSYLAANVCLPTWIKSLKVLVVIFACILVWIEVKALKCALAFWLSAMWNKWLLEVSKALGYMAWLSVFGCFS